MRVHGALSHPPRAHPGQLQLADDDLVLGMVVEGTAVAYPIRFLNLAEVVNDTVGGIPVAVTWCPLAGSAAVFRREMEEGAAVFHFGAGLLHDNLIMVDEGTASVWSQLGGEAIDGPLRGRGLEPLPSVQTIWGYWEEGRPDTEVIFFPDVEGVVYHHADFDPATLPVPRPTKRDLTPLGLGVVAEDGSAWFLPLPYVQASGAAGGLRLEDTSGTVRFAEEGMTA